MKAFILAAGEGRRLRPHTLQQPKPLIEAGGRSLIHWHIDKLRAAGIIDLVINSHWLAEQLHRELGDGSSLGVCIRWSHEPLLLDTGGGIRAALPLLGDEPFALISGDVWSDIDYLALTGRDLRDADAHLLMVPNPDFHSEGDFVLDDGGRLRPSGEQGMPCTYSGIGLINPDWVARWSQAGPVFPLRQPLQAAVAEGRVLGSLHPGQWTDVGTPERLQGLRTRLAH